MDTKQIQMMAAEIYCLQSDGQDFADRLGGGSAQDKAGTILASQSIAWRNVKFGASFCTGMVVKPYMLSLNNNSHKSSLKALMRDLALINARD
jgi:hypothetical protein